MLNSVGGSAPVSLTPLVEPAAIVADLRHQGFALLPVSRRGPWLAPFYAVLDDEENCGRSSHQACLARSSLHSVSLKDQPGVKRRAQLRRKGRIEPAVPVVPQGRSGSVVETSNARANDTASASLADACIKSEAEASFEALESLAKRCFEAVCEDVGLPFGHVSTRLFPSGSKHKSVFNAMLYVDGGRRSNSSVEESSRQVSKPTIDRGEAVDGKEASIVKASVEGTFQIHGDLDSDLVSEPWCRSHGDPGLLTLLTRSDLAALQLKARDGDGGFDDTEHNIVKWIEIEPHMDQLCHELCARFAVDSVSSIGDVSHSGNSDSYGVEVLLLIAGYSLERLTGGAYKACVHRVPRCEVPGSRRHTAAFELRPAVDIWQTWDDEVSQEERRSRL